MIFALVDTLTDLGACAEALEWLGNRTLFDTWRECERADWLLWLCGRMVGNPGWPTQQQVVLAACACAETALSSVPMGEGRPKKAIETARAWAEGRATIEEVRSAAHATIPYTVAAAYKVAVAAYNAAAAAYASTSGATAAAAAEAAHATVAANAAVYADDSVVEKSNKHKELCTLIRGMLTIPETLEFEK